MSFSACGSNKNSLELDQTLLKKIRRVQDTLSKKLTEFLNSDIYYYVRRILTAELQHLYIGPVEGIKVEICA